MTRWHVIATDINGTEMVWSVHRTKADACAALEAAQKRCRFKLTVRKWTKGD